MQHLHIQPKSHKCQTLFKQRKMYELQEIV